MKKDDFLIKFIKSLETQGFQIDYFFSYNNKIRIRLNNIHLIIDFNPDQKAPYYKILNGVGYKYIQEVKAKNINEIINKFIRLTHPYRDILKQIGQRLFIGDSFKFKPDNLGDIFPFLSYEEKGRNSELLIRFTNKCNQRCEFCSAPIDYIDPDLNILKMLIKHLTRSYNFHITLTGGEPTIRREFIEFVNWLVENTDSEVIRIQTNAVSLSNTILVAKLPKSNRLQFFISLHSLDEKTYDIITSSKGQLQKAICGIKNIIRKGYNVIANVVINKYNYDFMDDYLMKFNKLFKNKASIHFSVLILPEYRNNLEKYIVPYKEIIKKLLPLMQRYKIPISSLISSTHASIPLCYFPQKYIKDVKLNYKVNPSETGYEDITKSWIKAKNCKKCKYNQYCIGVPKEYYKIYAIR